MDSIQHPFYFYSVLQRYNHYDGGGAGAGRLLFLADDNCAMPLVQT